MGKLDGKVAFITGAAMGNGKGGARAFAKHGAHVVLADMNAEALAKTEQEFKDAGYKVSSVVLNVTDAEACKAAAAKVVAELGKIDILLNNAGISKCAPFHEMPLSMRDAHIEVNIKGIWNVAAAIYPYMMKAKYGKIINLSSVTGTMVVDPGETAYGMSKAAVWGFTKGLATEGAQYNITVNAICPGYVMTPMAWDMAVQSNPENPQAAIDAMAAAIPMKRLCTIDELGDLAVFLGCDESSYITGTQIVIDGGSTLPETFGAIGVE